MSSPSPSPSLHDASMAFHDASALPFPSLPRPSTPLQSFITRLVLAQDAAAAASQLSSLALRDPSCIPHIVFSLRKHYFPLFPSLPSAHAPLLLHSLVVSVPYFYRYIASPVFARGLRRLAVSSSPAAVRARLLLAAWARDLAPLARAKDPAAMLWLSAYRRARRSIDIPFPRPPPRRFVCSVPVPDAPGPPDLNPGHRMDPADVAATLKLLEQVVLAAKRKERIVADACKDGGWRKRPPRGPGGAVRVNEKVLSILRRHDDQFPGEEVIGFEDSAITLKVASEKGGSSGALSVAEVAKINARKKISESQRSLTVSWIGRSEDDTFDRLGMEREVMQELEEVAVEKAITPSTFADMGIGEDRTDVLHEYRQRQGSGIEDSMGDTIKLDGLELGSGDGNTSVGQKILRFMAAALARGDQGGAGTGSAGQGRSVDGDGVRVSVGRVC